MRGWIHWEDTRVHARVHARIKKRASPTEWMLACVCGEAGAALSSTHLCDMKLGVLGNDERRIEVLAQDLFCFVSLGPSWQSTLLGASPSRQVVLEAMLIGRGRC